MSPFLLLSRPLFLSPNVLVMAVSAVGQYCHPGVSKGKAQRSNILPEAILWGSELDSTDFLKLFFLFCV